MMIAQTFEDELHCRFPASTPNGGSHLILRHLWILLPLPLGRQRPIQEAKHSKMNCLTLADAHCESNERDATRIKRSGQ